MAITNTARTTVNSVMAIVESARTLIIQCARLHRRRAKKVNGLTCTSRKDIHIALPIAHFDALGIPHLSP